MSTKSIRDGRVSELYQTYADGRISRREFMRRAAALGVAGAAALGELRANPAASTIVPQTEGPAGTEPLALDVAEWSYMWVNVKRADTARGSFVGGQQMYVEYMVPSEVRHPFPIVLVHGGGGQGLDWMGTPDGRPGWFQHLVAEGFKVYVVDRPGHGRSPQHPLLHGGIPDRAGTMEGLSGNFTPPTSDNTDPYRRNHTQWPGPGVVGSADTAQFLASQGGSYVVRPGGAGGPPDPTVPANQRAAGQPNLAHMTWREAGADLLDQIGPAIIMTHSAGGAFGLLVAEARPDLVPATIMVEGGGQPFAGGNRWGMSTIPVTYDPPIEDPSEIAVMRVDNPEPGVEGYWLQTEPARRLPNLANTAVLAVTAEASRAAPGSPGQVAFLRQAGVKAEELRIADVGIHGNGHMMMVERNNRQVLQPILDWIDKNVTGPTPSVPRRGTESTALKLANSGFFWVGTEAKEMDYGTIIVGQMYVQYLIPEEVRYPTPIVLVHGGGGQMTHNMGINGNAGWAHYYAQAGYQVYLVDRPGHGRISYRLDTLGPIGNLPMYAGISRDFQRAAAGNPSRWEGTGQIGDPLLDQFMAGQNAAPRNGEQMQEYGRSRGGELLDKIGPAIIQTHSAGGPFGWIVADERPELTRALICYEGGGAPLVGRGDNPGRTLPKLRNIPMLYLTAENSGRAQRGPRIVEALRESGAAAEHLNLGDRGITGNGHFAMIETNRKEVFDVIRGWIEEKLPS